MTIPNSLRPDIIEFITLNGFFTIDGVSTIRSSAFTGCTSLTSVTFEGSAIYDHSYYETNLMKDIISIGNIFDMIGVAIDAYCNSYNRGFYDNAFPQGSSGAGGNALKTAYLAGGAGTYTRTPGGSNWTKGW